ncbi:MAG TPA: glycogen/starch/alpha-glucan phosphorylase, partial [Myxococcaceae bacterium]|nr:glycogen/starch/alpha-glucan phosphorylase [Myxococcaceae bacterium]
MATTTPLTSKPRSELEASPSARSAWADDGCDPESLRRAFLDHLRYSRGKNPENATTYDRFNALALTVRDRLANRWVHTQRAYYQKDVKRAYYLSAEYLLGRVLENNLLNLGLLEEARAVLQSEGVDLDALLETEPDPGLGNGGLGRLAACFLDSMATLGLPGFGYGIRYEFGIFTQDIVGGHQIE